MNAPIRAPYNAVATYPDRPAAREAIAALENRGVDAGHIGLGGRLASAAEQATSRADTRQRDQAVAAKSGRIAGGGILIGAVVGALLGALSSFLAFGGAATGQFTGGLVAFAIGGAAAGAGVGLAVGAYSRVKQSQAWETTYDDAGGAFGEVTVEVRTDDREEFDTAVEVLRSHDARRLELTDAHGGRLSPS
jgi:hypothetical protein